MSYDNRVPPFPKSFARGIPGIAPGKFARSFSSWHSFLAKCNISCSEMEDVLPKLDRMRSGD